MKKLTIVTLALSLGLAATGCKKKMSGRGPSDPGMDDGTTSSGCCDTGRGADAGGALVPLAFVVFGLARITRRRARG